MRTAAAVLMVAGLAVAATLPLRGSDRSAVEVVRKDAERRVDILIGGQPFTSYLYPAAAKKPILFPLLSADGRPVTRGFPLAPQQGERTDHPHQVGHWFNFGDVNGFDFWGHSDATPKGNLPRMGSIVHTGIVRASGGAGSGELAVKADWIAADGTTLLHEETTFTFRGGADWRSVDRKTTWTAASGTVTFGDTKEGAFGIRVARGLEHPSTEPGTFVNQSGEVAKVPVRDNEGVAGEYLASDGTRGEKVWGRRGPWMALSGLVEGATVTLAIFDHPSNHGFPTRWHARGYGLFAANPFGQHSFDPSLPAAPFALESGESLTFLHRIAIRQGKQTRQQLQAHYEEFAGAAATAR